MANAWYFYRTISAATEASPIPPEVLYIHGWVTKLRGTLSDNEKVRRAGIHEMRAAKAVRKWKKERSNRKGSSSSSGGGFLSLFGLGSKKRSSSKAVVRRDPPRRNSSKRGGSTDVTLAGQPETAPVVRRHRDGIQRHPGARGPIKNPGQRGITHAAQPVHDDHFSLSLTDELSSHPAFTYTFTPYRLYQPLA
ncbi:hypothetical protein BC629DRAFT_1593576 [Irpex lacteus]|nr:hypothetical protein BC629DRAFT_1593576 [Irpex lacteus]